MSRMLIFHRLAAFTTPRCPDVVLWSIILNFSKLSSCERQIAYALLTRLPVASGIATLMPRDLHVLSLPQAFILSQDQTLLGIFCFLLFPWLQLRSLPYEN